MNLDIPDSVGIIGVGGVGSWVGMNMALTGVKKIILVDHDKIEPHNLNRTIFRTLDIGEYKVFALSRLIYERREDIEVIALNKKVEDLDRIEREELYGCDVIVDCRDKSGGLNKKLQKKTKVIGGYDGFGITLHFNPDFDKIWGEGEARYSITPSWLVPPQFLANMITLYLCCKDIQTKKEIIKTMNIKEVVKWLKGEGE